MDNYSRGYWMGFGMGVAGALISNCYDPKYPAAAGINEELELFGDGVHNGYHDARTSGGDKPENISDEDIRWILDI